jgi:hypothetical protein
MRFRLIQFVCAIALVALYSPLRGCVLETVTLGTSCHDAEDKSPASSDADHDASCTCDAPKDSTKASKPIVVALTPAIQPAILNPFESRPILTSYAESTTDPPRISATQHPLLL